MIGVAGLAAIGVSMILDGSGVKLYAVYDYWHTSPNFLLARCGVMLVILSLAHAWYRWGLAQAGFSPVEQLGRTSLLVYWVHIEFVYGRASILHKRANSIPMASLGLLTIFLAMLALSAGKTKWKSRGFQKAEIARGARAAAR